MEYVSESQARKSSQILCVMRVHESQCVVSYRSSFHAGRDVFDRRAPPSVYIIMKATIAATAPTEHFTIPTSFQDHAAFALGVRPMAGDCSAVVAADEADVAAEDDADPLRAVVDAGADTLGNVVPADGPELYTEDGPGSAVETLVPGTVVTEVTTT